MAIVWGGAVNNFRLGIDIVGNTWIVYGQSLAYGHNWSYTLHFSGAWGGGSKSGHFSSGHGQTVTRELHRTTRPNVSQSNSVLLRSVLVNGASVSRSITVTPKPAAPRIDRVVRNSDTSHRVEWSRFAVATSVRVERSTNGGGWQHVGSMSSNASSFTDKTTKAGNSYRYRVRVANAGGTSGWSNTSKTVYTTPAAPSRVSASRRGDDIRVDASVPSLASHVDIQDDGVTVVSALGKGGLPWTHKSPDQTVTHKYRMRSRVASGTSNNTTLYSGWSPYSATVQLTAPPAAPTGLKPNGGVIEENTPAQLSWQHNPVDSSDQSAYELRYRVDAGSWTVLSGGEDSSRTVVFDAGQVEWQVRTKGAHPDWSPWSAVALFVVVSKPQVAIVSPDEGGWLEASLPVVWNFFQGEGRPQSAWRARLLRDGQPVETREGTGATDRVLFRTRLEDQVSYLVEVEAATGTVWSDVESVTVDVAFVLPQPGVLEGAWNESTGAVDLQVSILDQPSHPDVVNYAPRIEGDGTWAEVARFTTGDAPPEMAQPEDFRIRDLGTGESVLEIETVSGLTAANCIAGVSTRDGKPAMRLIPTGASSLSYAWSDIPVEARSSGTALGTLYLDEPLTGSLNTDALSIRVHTPTQKETATNTAGEHPLRLGFSGITSGNTLRLYHGGAQDSGEVWWTDIGLFAGTYQGDFFDGDTEWVQVDGVWMHTRWNSDGTSTASMPDTAVTMTVERSIDNGVTWQPVLVDETGTVQVSDHEALSNGVTIYRVTTYAATGAATVREYPVPSDSDALWLGGGIGHAETCRLPYSPQVSISGGRERVLKRYSGRSKPVVYAGEATSRTVDTNGMILVDETDNTQPDDLIRVAQNEEPTHLYRDPDGRHVTGMLTDAQVARQSHAHWSYSFQLEESEA